MSKKQPLFKGMAVNCSPPSPVQIIYKSVLYDKNISSTSKFIHCEIVNNCEFNNNYCSLTNKQIADVFGLSKASISIKISELIKAGYLKSHTVQVEAFPGADYTIAERRLSW